MKATNPQAITLQTNLFDTPEQPIRIDQQYKMANADILYWPEFISPSDASNYLQQIYNSLSWEQRKLQVYNKVHLTPRLIAWCADPGVLYRYSNDVTPRQNWPEPLLKLKEKIEESSGCRFNGALLNYYRDGDDAMGWHSDDEQSLGERPAIASLSLGQTRTFQFKPKPPQQGERIDIDLSNGSLLLMCGNTQKFWQHALPRRKQIISPRLNITFRYIYDN